MKLRLRSLESKQTLKIEVPDPCSFQQLKFTISRTIPSPPSSSSSSSSSSSLHLSLNRKDEITPSSLHDSLHSIGITAGDLIFYTFNPNAFTHSNENSSEITMIDAVSIPDAEKFPSLETSESETIEMIDGSDEAEAMILKNNSEPEFVKRVLKEAIGDDVNDFKLMVFSIHAVILESGFVRVDQVSGMAVSCSNLVDDMSCSSMISLRYTLPQILTKGLSHSVNLKIQTLGNFVNVCGSLSDDVGSRVHRVYLDKLRFAKPLELMLLNSSVNDDDDDGGDEVFELWKIVKDKLALPLLIDLCEKAGLDLPPCFMRLPMELKLSIFECLAGDDLAKVCCTCSELKYLASNDELWKKKFEEEFGQRADGMKFFKNLFAHHRAEKNRMKPRPFRNNRTGIMRYFQRRRGPIPFGVPLIWGGEFDRQPGFGQNGPNPFGIPQIWGGEFVLPPGFGQNRPTYAYAPRRTFSPQCNLADL